MVNIYTPLPLERGGGGCQDSKKKDRKVHKVHDIIKDQGKKKVTKSA